MIPRLKELYKKEILPELKTKLGLKNDYMTPKLTKVVLNNNTHRGREEARSTH